MICDEGPALSESTTALTARFFAQKLESDGSALALQGVWFPRNYHRGLGYESTRSAFLVSHKVSPSAFETSAQGRKRPSRTTSSVCELLNCSLEIDRSNMHPSMAVSVLSRRERAPCRLAFLGAAGKCSGWSLGLIIQTCGPAP